MEAITGSTLSLKNLLHLPRFAHYLLTEKLNDYIEKQFEYGVALQVPLLKHFMALPEDQRRAVSLQSASDFLRYLADNRAAEQIESSITQWKDNRLPVMDKDDIVAEDITLINHIRKRSMLDLVPGYASDAHEIIELVKEIDLFTVQAITAATNQFLDFFREKLEERSHFIQKVAETVPGAVYVFDLEEHKGVYANNKLPGIIGYTQTELNALGTETVHRLVHPDDREGLQTQLETMRRCQTEETSLCKYRIRMPDGNYKWLANYESVFKRKPDGAVWQTIGITLDIDNEQKTLEALHHREQQLLEAQDIAQFGNYYWDFEEKTSAVSPKAIELLEVDNVAFEPFWEKVHPEDREGLMAAIKAAYETGHFTAQYRIRGATKTKHIWSRGVVNFRDGKAVGMTGTVMDITEHNQLLQQLAAADQRHRQAEALAHIGTYTRYLKSGVVEWSEEMRRIFELDDAEPLDYRRLLDFVLPEDRAVFEKTVAESVNDRKPFDFYYRIHTKGGRVKIIHSRGDVQTGEDGEPEKLVGTEQDVTEKQNLIRRLQKTESLYRQAEQIADMGNWSWDVELDKLEWTDQLYRIYGLEPQSEEITIERFLSFVHPADKEYVSRGVYELEREDSLDYTFRIVTADGTEKWLRSLAQVHRNDRGQITSVIGTEQNVTERQKLVGKLEESQRLYKQAQELAQLGNFSRHLRTGELVWSDEVYKIYEKPLGQPITREDPYTPVIPEHKEMLRNAINETIETRKSKSLVFALRKGDGGLKYISLITDVSLSKDNEVEKLIGTVQDVTEKEELIHRLRESQTFIRKITDATPSIIASYHVSTGRYTYISEGVEKLLGYPADEAMEKGTEFFAALVHPDDLPLITEKNAQALAEANADGDKKDTVAEFTYRMKHRDGRYRWFHTYGTVFDYNAEGKVEHILNITLDVTEQKEAVETIREQEYFIQQIADASPTILYLFDVPSQSIAYINREAFFVLGYLPEELLEEGANVTETLYHPDDWPLLPGRRQSGKNFQQVDSMIQYECRMRHKDGAYRWLLVREIVFKTDGGNIAQIIGAALDITRRKEMERTILQNANQLEQSNASLEEFAYVASHDLKEPLRKISTFGDRLASSHMDNLSEEGKMYLRKIIDASQRMQNMISDLLSISMISGNRSFERVSLQKILEETLQTLEFKIENQKAVVRYDALPEAAVVPSQFRQLFQNLLSNSLKFVKEDVLPEIIVSHEVLDPEAVTAWQVAKAPAYLRLVFADNGIGFEPEYAQKIFAIFHRLHGRSEYEGSGIGLAICKKIAEHHGGIIFAEGQPGQGASFTVIIPA